MSIPAQVLPALVAAAHLDCRFGPVHAVRDASFAIHAGQQIAVAGASGSGKSTLLRLIAGLQPASGGAIIWPGLPWDPRLDRTLIVMVFQEPSLLEPLTAMQNVALPLLLAGRSEAEGTGAADAALAAVGIGVLRERMPAEISSGQSQRVAVARAMATRPRLIVADEPTGFLDHETAVRVIDALRGAVAATGGALLVATHDPKIADLFSRRWHMRDGCLRTRLDRAAPEDSR